MSQVSKRGWQAVPSGFHELQIQAAFSQLCFSGSQAHLARGTNIGIGLGLDRWNSLPSPSAVAAKHLTLSCWTRHQAVPAVQGPHLWSSTATVQPSLRRLSARLSIRSSTLTDLDWMSKPLARLKMPRRGGAVPAQSEPG